MMPLADKYLIGMAIGHGKVTEAVIYDSSMNWLRPSRVRHIGRH
jgi:hypothetical protein